MHYLESAFVQHANVIRRFEPLEDNRSLVAIHDTKNTYAVIQIKPEGDEMTLIHL
jgi:hypothetical protein